MSAKLKHSESLSLFRFGWKRDKADLAVVLTDLYVQPTLPHSQKEQAQYLELMKNLIPHLDAEYREELREKLSSRADCPQEIWEILGGEGQVTGLPHVSENCDASASQVRTAALNADLLTAETPSAPSNHFEEVVQRLHPVQDASATTEDRLPDVIEIYPASERALHSGDDNSTASEQLNPEPDAQNENSCINTSTKLSSEIQDNALSDQNAEDAIEHSSIALYENWFKLAYGFDLLSASQKKAALLNAAYDLPEGKLDLPAISADDRKLFVYLCMQQREAAQIDFLIQKAGLSYSVCDRIVRDMSGCSMLAAVKILGIGKNEATNIFLRTGRVGCSIGEFHGIMSLYDNVDQVSATRIYQALMGEFVDPDFILPEDQTQCSIPAESIIDSQSARTIHKDMGNSDESQAQETTAVMHIATEEQTESLNHEMNEEFSCVPEAIGSMALSVEHQNDGLASQGISAEFKSHGFHGWRVQVF